MSWRRFNRSVHVLWRFLAILADPDAVPTQVMAELIEPTAEV
jgi:hypothetical protein